MNEEPKFFGPSDDSWWEEWAPLLWPLIVLVVLFTLTMLVWLFTKG